MIFLLFLIFLKSKSHDKLWTWIGGYQSDNLNKVIYTQGTPHPNNAPGGIIGSCIFYENDILYVFFGKYNGNDEYVNHFWKLDTVSRLWTFVSGEVDVLEPHGNYTTLGEYHKSNYPGGRANHFCTTRTIGNDIELFMYGGFGYRTRWLGDKDPVSELWSYSMEKEMWNYLSQTSFSGSFVNKGVFDVGFPPAKQNGQIFIFGNSSYIFGGKNNPGASNDLWEYDIKGDQYRWVTGNETTGAKSTYIEPQIYDPSNIPNAVFGFCGWKVGNSSFMIFGGETETHVSSELWEFDIKTDLWRIRFSDNIASVNGPQCGNDYDETNSPGPLRGCNCVKINENEYAVIAGNNEPLSFYNTIHFFEYTSSSWKTVGGDCNPNKFSKYDTPGDFSSMAEMGGRYYSNAVLSASNEILFFGGYGRRQCGSETLLNDVWQFSLDSQNFKYITGYRNEGSGEYSNSVFPPYPGKRRDGAYFKINDYKFGIFGGEGFDSTCSNVYLSDLWEYDARSNTFEIIIDSKRGQTKSVHGSYFEFSVNNRIGCRARAVAGLLNETQYLIFGGRGIDFVKTEPLSSLFIFDSETKEVALYDGGGNSAFVLASYREFDDMNTIGSRVYHYGFIYKSRYYVNFGGETKNNKLRNDVMMYDTVDKQWMWMDGDDDEVPGVFEPAWNITIHPGSRQKSCGWLYNNVFYIFGGDGFDKIGNRGFLKDLWMYNLTGFGWTYVVGSKISNDVTGTDFLYYNASNQPLPLESSQGARFGDGNELYLFGGLYGLSYIQGIWSFNVNKTMWKLHNVTKGKFSSEFGVYGEKEISRIENYPGGRTGHALFVSNGKFIVFGGNGFNVQTFQNNNDMWMIQMETVCFGHTKDDPRVCSGHGDCLEDAHCICETDYLGDNCHVNECFGILSNNSDVCSSHGNCVDYDECQCDSNHRGNHCSFPMCFGIAANEAGACNSFGTCVSVDTCSCTWFRKQPNCVYVEEYLFIVIIFSIVLCLCIFAVVILLVILFLCRSRIKKFANAVKAIGKLDDIELLLEEQALEKDTTIAHLKINKKLFEIDFSELTIGKSIGKGCDTSVVYKCKYQNSDVAFKCFKIQDFMSQDRFNEFEKEASLLASLKHPHIITFFGCTMKPPRIGILVEYCEKGDLKKFLKTYRNDKKEGYPLKEKLRVFKEICSGMAFLHSRSPKVIHRDLKCENVLIDDKYKVKIMDFGISRMIENVTQTKTKRIGSTYHIAPEVSLGEKYDEKCDVFSFGMLAYELLSENFEPFGSVTFSLEFKIAKDRNFRPRIEKGEHFPKMWMVALIKSCWEENPSKRPSFQEMFEIVEKQESKKDGDKTEKTIKVKAQIKGSEKIEEVEVDYLSVFDVRQSVSMFWKGKNVKELYVKENDKLVLLRDKDQLKDEKTLCVVVELEKTTKEMIEEISAEMEEMEKEEKSLIEELNKYKEKFGDL